MVDSSKYWEIQLLKRAWECVKQSLKPRLPLSLGCVSLCHATRGLFFLQVVLECPQMKSLNILEIFFAIPLGVAT